MICPLGRKEGACPRSRFLACIGDDEACHADLDERAAHVAHWQGLGAPPLSPSASMRLAVEQAKAALPGQVQLI